MIPQKQLTWADIFEDCKEIFDSDKPHFLTLLENHIDLDEIVPISFRHHYYASTGRNRKYPLNAMLWALIIQRLLSIPTDSAYVTENNPKYANRIIKQLKAYAKANSFDDSYDPYKAAYASMPTSAASNHEVKQQYINGHFCYAYKFGILVNGLGIARSIDFYNKDYLNSHPDIVVEKKSKSPDEDKSLADSKALLPTLRDFKNKHPDIHPEIFLGDAAFDTIEIYKSLFSSRLRNSITSFAITYTTHIIFEDMLIIPRGINLAILFAQA